MTDETRERVVTAFPELGSIEADELREGVVDAWVTALEETGWDLDELPWFPPAQRDLGLSDERLLDHVRDVAALSVGMAEVILDRRDVHLSLDLVIAGALVHDVSKPYEFAPDGDTPVYELLGHPHYGVHLVTRAGLPVEVAHVVLSHTDRTAVEPATLEAAIVRRADEAAAAAIRSRAGTRDSLGVKDRN